MMKQVRFKLYGRKILEIPLQERFSGIEMYFFVDLCMMMGTGNF